MTWWVYKCNNTNKNNPDVSGNWDWLFDNNPPKHLENTDLKKLNDDNKKKPARRWGSSEWIKDLAKLKQGDKVIAYQTDRNEFVGIAEVFKDCNEDTYLYLKPGDPIRVKVRPLKKIDKKISDIPAFKGGPIKTIYDISESDAEYLKKVAKEQLK